MTPEESQAFIEQIIAEEKKRLTARQREIIRRPVKRPTR